MQVVRNIFPFMKNDVSKMIRIFQLFRQAVFDGIFFYFFLESSENFIPDDQHHSHISIEVSNVTSMMDPVMRRTYKKGFKPTRHFINVLSMNQYSINLRKGIHKYNIQRFKTE